MSKMKLEDWMWIVVFVVTVGFLLLPVIIGLIGGVVNSITLSAEKPTPVVSTPGEFKSEVSCDGIKYSGEELSLAAKLAVKSKLMNDGNPYSNLSTSHLEGEIQKLYAMEKWATAYVEDAKIREAYLTWIDLYRRSYIIVLDDIKAPAEDKLQKEQMQERARKLAKCLPQLETGK